MLCRAIRTCTESIRSIHVWRIQKDTLTESSFSTATHRVSFSSHVNVTHLHLISNGYFTKHRLLSVLVSFIVRNNSRIPGCEISPLAPLWYVNFRVRLKPWAYADVADYWWCSGFLCLPGTQSWERCAAVHTSEKHVLFLAGWDIGGYYEKKYV